MQKPSIMAAIIGNVIEWYDFTLYVFLSPVIAHNFFSQQNPLNALLSTFLVFAMGFFIWLRRDIHETPVFHQLYSQAKIPAIPLLMLLKKYKTAVLRVFLLVVMAATGSYALMDFMSTYLHQFFNYSLSHALQIQSIYNTLTFVLVALAAKLADRYGRRALLMTAAIGFIVLSVPCFYLLKTTGSWLWLLPLVIIYCIEESTTPATMVELFPAATRYTGISIGYNLGMALLGGTAPLVNTWLVAKFHNPMIIAYYLAAAAAISLLSVIIFLPHQFGESCNLLDDAVSDNNEIVRVC